MEIVGASRRPLSRRGGFLGVCRNAADHPVSRFATATPPKEGNYSTVTLTSSFDYGATLRNNRMSMTTKGGHALV